MQGWTPLLLLLALSLPAQAPSAPQAHARLEGRVVDPQQRPVVGAQVVAELDGEPLGRTFTDAQGTFVFGKLPRAIVTLRATTKAPDVGGNWVDLLGLDRGFVRIVTMPARKVAGIVRDDAGQPVAGAWVVAAPNDAIEFAHASCIAQSDANGRYELSHAAMGALLVRAWAPGCDAFEGAAGGTTDVALDPVVEQGSARERRFTLAGATPEQLARAALHVRCVANGQPFPLPPPLRRPRPGADGAWIVPGWPDELRVSLVLPGARITPLSRRIVPAIDRTWREFTLDDAEATIHGTLQWPDGKAAGEHAVVVQPFGEVIDNYTRFVAPTRPDGTFTLPSPVGRGERFALRVCAGSGVVDNQDLVRTILAKGERPASDARAWLVTEHALAAHHTVKLRRASSVRLRVMTPEGTPAYGAAAAIHPAVTRPVGAGLSVPLAASGDQLAFGQSDSDGRVEIRGLDLRDKEDLACLVLAEAGFGEVAFQVGTGADDDLGTLQLAATATLVGTCLDADGKPAPARRAAVVSSWFRGVQIRHVVATDRDGRFAVFGLLPGNYSVMTLGERGLVQTLPLSAGVNEVTLR